MSKKITLVPLIVSVILFFVPFFWFQFGEMDLGGDSSRLYFYDPVSYLSKASLYIVSPSSFGAEYLGYSNAPFIFFLVLLKAIFVSPSILICIFYGISLSSAFLFTYLSIKELLAAKENWLASTIGGLLYVFSPPTQDGWKHVLITYNHVFLSPLIFYLLLKYFKTANIRYIFVVVLITFIFSPNFSVSAAPAIFSFFPLSILFLITYTKVILKRKIIIKHIVLGIFLFVGIQAFHLFVIASSIFSSGSDIHSTIFTEKGKFDRGLSYFSAIAPNIKASFNLMLVPQMKTIYFFSKIFFIFPVIIIIAFILKRKKTMLLTAIFFLVVLFFTTGNITNIWLSIYKSLFSVPGFSMFRNFHSQWVYTYVFFYALLFGQALSILIDVLDRRYRYGLTFFLIIIITLSALPIIKGNIANEVLWQSENVKSVLTIDPDFEEALSYMRSLPVDAKVLSLPLTDPGYQIIAGKNGGAYMGPSTISYLAGKKDFAGYDEFLGFKEIILQLIKDKDYEKLKKLLGILNIKYIFYDADPLIYNKFPSFPYENVRTVLPKNQKLYTRFIEELHLKKIKSINNKFFVFELPDEYFSPHVTIINRSVSFNNGILDIGSPLSLYKENNWAVAFNSSELSKNSLLAFDEDLRNINDAVLYPILTASKHTSPYGFPFVSWSMASPVYPFIVIRERNELENLSPMEEIYIDRTIFLAEKRIAELEKWGNETKLIGNVGDIGQLDVVWKEPSLLKAIFFQKYNYWEVNFLRYYRIIGTMINRIEKDTVSNSKIIADKYVINNALLKDKENLLRIIQSSENLSEQQKLYLLKLSMDMFSFFEDRLQVDIPALDNLDYKQSFLEKGDYSVYIDKRFIQEYGREGFSISTGGIVYLLDELTYETSWGKIPYTKTSQQDQNDFTIRFNQPPNLISPTSWNSFEKQTLASDAATISIEDDLRAVGIIREIADWQPKTSYLISFKYRTNGKRFKIVVFDDSGKKIDRKSTILQQNLYSQEWISYKSILTSSDNATLGYIHFLKSFDSDIFNKLKLGEGIAKIEIKDLSVVKIPTPKIVTRKIGQQSQNEKLPILTFTKINPTKYIVNVKNIKESYTLVLNDHFNVNWKLVDPGNEDKDRILSFLTRVIGRIGKTGVSLLGLHKESQVENVLKFFNGSVNQNVTEDIYINANTFDTWGKTSIAEYKHFPVNGYANAWYIEPKDMDGKTEYTLIIEMTTQKLLYVYLALSVCVFFFTLALIFRSIFRRI